ncbi:MAG: PilZ domain-containing protein [candidate division NC10 bacterium]|nr:PilZ domain-containing protein [candidate division NC10 bacterium]MBI2117246.1 PilZ domain-containing protein [candidate division NC10 bacterium]MBI2458494.1 PilZ domain-containing protein [candidate division NC10 bacterium]
MAEFQERRRATRIAVSGRLGGRARAILDVRILDISLSGARIEHLSPLPPGSPCTFELPPVIGSLLLSARVVRSTVTGSEQTPDGKRLLRYESGIMFIGLKEEQQAALEKALEKLTPGGGLGDGRLFL